MRQVRIDAATAQSPGPVIQADLLPLAGHLGTSLGAVDAAGQVQEAVATDAFGQLRIPGSHSNPGGFTNAPAGGWQQSHLFAGEYWDQDAQLLYLRARWYDPQIGRFISADPFEGRQRDPRSLNRYAYSDGDPVHKSDPSGAMSMGELSMTMAIGGLMNVGMSYAFSQGDYGLTQAAKDFGIGAVAAPIGGAATRLLLPVLKSMVFAPALRVIGAADRITLYGKSGWQKLAVKTSRFFMNTNKAHPSVKSTFFGKLLTEIFPGAQWEMHHVFIQQAWSRTGSAAQVYSNVVANEGLRRLGNGGWNLMPIPPAFINWLGKDPLATQMFATAVYSALVFGPAQLADHLMDDDE